MSNIKYPVYKPSLTDKERSYLIDAFDSSWISSKGPYIDRLETAIAKHAGTKFALVSSSGTTALHLALLALGIGPGDEVITSVLSYVATANSIKYVGAKPVFVDIEPDSWNLSLSEIKKKVTEKTKAILVVHLYGEPCNKQIFEYAKENKIFVIEDAAESFNSYYYSTPFISKHTGSLGNVGCFSFFSNKTICFGEGGAIVSNDEDIYRKCKKFRGQGLAEGMTYWHDVVGYNYRLTNIQAAIGLAQLERIAEIQLNKNRVYGEYFKNLINLRNKLFIRFQHLSSKNISNHWMLNVLVYSRDRDETMLYLKKEGIETRPMFFPLVDFDMYKEEGDYPIARVISKHGITLPSYPDLTNEDIEFISEKFTKCVLGRT